jgi:hypothetical protein
MPCAYVLLAAWLSIPDAKPAAGHCVCGQGPLCTSSCLEFMPVLALSGYTPVCILREEASHHQSNRKVAKNPLVQKKMGAVPYSLGLGLALLLLPLCAAAALLSALCDT